MKDNGEYLVKRQSNTKHKYLNKDMLYYEPMSLEEYKQTLGN